MEQNAGPLLEELTPGLADVAAAGSDAVQADPAVAAFIADKAMSQDSAAPELRL
jgi:hypothetical protein